MDSSGSGPIIMDVDDNSFIDIGTNGNGETVTLGGSNDWVGIGAANPAELFSVGSNSQLTVDGSGNLSTSGTISSTATSNQIVLGTSNTTTLNATAPGASRIDTLPDAGANANVSLISGTGVLGVDPSAVTMSNVTQLYTMSFNTNTILTLSGGAVAGSLGIFEITSTNIGATITFSGNVKVNGTLHTPDIAGLVYTITFVYDGTNWVEISRVSTGM
jgi:hypothetical protein